MTSTKDLIDDKTTISSTRWAFVTIIKFDIFMIVASVFIFCLFHIKGNPLDTSFFYAVGTLLGVLTTLVVAPKALQGFEPKEEGEKEIIIRHEEVCEDDGK